MPTTIIQDTRSTDMMSVEQADELFSRLAKLEISVRKRLAAADKKIADIKQAAEEDVKADKAELKLLVDQLSIYVITHKERFQKPRKRRTNWGSYGLRTATKLEVIDETALKAISDDEGLDLYRIATTIDKKLVEKAIADGIDLKGTARLVSGDLASYDIDKSLLN